MDTTGTTTPLAPKTPHTDHPQPFRFFHLLPELRSKIYLCIYNNSQDLLASRLPTVPPREHIPSQTPYLPKKQYDQWKHYQSLYITIPLLLTSHQFRREYLEIWTAHHIHEVQLDLPAYCTLELCAPPLDRHFSIRRASRLLTTNNVAEAIYRRLRTFLQVFNTNPGLAANRIRRIQLQAQMVPGHLHLSALANPLHIIKSLRIPRIVQQLSRLDPTLAHPDLIIELEILATLDCKPYPGFVPRPLHRLQARRRVKLRQSHGRGVKAERDWRYEDDGRGTEVWVVLSCEEMNRRKVVGEWVGEGVYEGLVAS